MENANWRSALSGCLSDSRGSFFPYRDNARAAGVEKTPDFNTISANPLQKCRKLSLNEAVERAKQDISNATDIDVSSITITINI